MADPFYVVATNAPPGIYLLCDRSAKIRFNSEVVVRLLNEDGKPESGYLLAVVTTKRVHPRERIRVRWAGCETGHWVGLLKFWEVVPVVGRYQMVDI